MNFSSSIKLEPNFENKNEACEPNSAYHIHAEVETCKHTCLTTNHEKIANKHVKLPLLDSVLRVPFVRGLFLLDYDSLVDDEDRKKE